MNGPIQVVLADDHSLVRDTLADWLNRLPDIRVVGVCGSADEALEIARTSAPDVVVLDIDMPGQFAFEAARRLQRERANVRVIFLSAFSNDRYVEQALASRAAGYLTKGEPPQEVARAIRNVHSGRTCFSPEIQSRIVVESGGLRLAGASATRTAMLSDRELEVLRYLAQAKARKEIARLLNLSVHTVDRHTANIMHKLDIHDRAALCRFAIREGLIEA